MGIFDNLKNKVNFDELKDKVKFDELKEKAELSIGDTIFFIADKAEFNPSGMMRRLKRTISCA